MGCNGYVQCLAGATNAATTGAPSGDCGSCLASGEAGLFGQACQPASHPACNASACSQQIAACRADG